MPGTTLGANRPDRAARLRAQQNPADGLSAEELVERFSLKELKDLARRLSLVMPKKQTKKALAALVAEAS